jgi:chromosome segregation ATPase
MAPKTKGTKRGAQAPAVSPKAAKSPKTAKKSEGDPDMAAVTEAIGMAQITLSESCRLMLTAAAPHALGVFKADRIASQTLLVEMIEEAIASVEASLKAASASTAEHLKEVQDSKGQLQGNVDAATEALATATTLLATKTEVLTAADATLKAATASAKEAQKNKESTEKDFEKAKKEKESFEAFLAADFIVLKEGTWEKQTDAGKKCRHLESLVAAIEPSLESSLMTALPGVFSKKPDERGMFEKIVVETIEKQLNEQVEKLTKTVGDWPATVSERASAAEAAEKALSEATEAKNAALAAVGEAKNGKTAAAKDLKEAEHNLKNQDSTLKSATKSKDAADAALSKFETHNMQRFAALKEKAAPPPEPVEEIVDDDKEEAVTAPAVEAAAGMEP